jgi:hypothetical protein
MTSSNSKNEEFIEVNPMPRAKRSGGIGRPARELVEGRLYSIALDELGTEHLDGVTVLINMSDDIGLSDLGVPVTLTWVSNDNVEERVLEGVVRLCSSSMKGGRQKVLLVGSQDAIDTLAACILREYIGCTAGQVFTIMREGHPDCLQKHELMETILKYKPS